MNSSLIYASVYLGLVIFSFYDWKKYADRNSLWFTLLGVTGVFLEMAHYLLIAFSASQEVISRMRILVRVFDVVLLAAIILIVVRKYTKKK